MSIEDMMFWGFVIAVLAILGTMFIVAMIDAIVEAKGKKKRKMKNGIVVIVLWFVMNIAIAIAPTMIDKIYPLNEKLTVIVTYGGFAILGIANVIFWSRVECEEGGKDNGKRI
jgi:hypothetical protein